MKNNDARRKLLNEVVGPEIPFGKHSKYYTKGEQVVVITRKGADEELPDNVDLDIRTRSIVFEDSKGNIKYKFDRIKNSKRVYSYDEYGD